MLDWDPLGRLGQNASNKTSTDISQTDTFYGQEEMEIDKQQLAEQASRENDSKEEMGDIEFEEELHLHESLTSLDLATALIMFKLKLDLIGKAMNALLNY
ncbi:unnamed protein product [Didymodactylos carnosus]|nr:unnamed protein product [Didymodactylos carnosus]CAF4115410.1 unnamed protein product [Didymodactylos carnosus]